MEINNIELSKVLVKRRDELLAFRSLLKSHNQSQKKIITVMQGSSSDENIAVPECIQGCIYGSIHKVMQAYIDKAEAEIREL